MDKKANIIIIAGPTGSGKTKMAVELAKKIDGEIINADSRSIYRGMDIGTGKPEFQSTDYRLPATVLLHNGIPHHLFDILSPDETFSVAEFKELANEKIKEIKERGKVPIVVGGTGLYIDALVYNYGIKYRVSSIEYREKLENKSLEDLQKEIQKIDKNLVKESEMKNKRRLVSALEMYYETGEAKSQEKKPLPKNILYFAILFPREELYKKINQRVSKMFEDGLKSETENLLKKYPADTPMLQTMGYKESIQFLNNKISKNEAISRTAQAHRNLAKRQLTWFRRNKDIIWVEDLDDILKAYKNS